MHCPSLLLILLLAFPTVLVQGERRVGKSIVNYLGTNHILLDGCPDPDCGIDDEECQKKHSELLSKFSQCTQSEEGQSVGCVTYKINKGTTELTVPVYANRCSAMCYEGDPQGMKRVQRCPHQGTRQHGEGLQKLF